MINRLRAAALIALAPYMVLSQTAFPSPAGSADIGATSRMLIAEAKVPNDSAPAISGVKLLHEIFQRLRNSNQLALNNPTKQLAAASQAFRGSLDPLLAIRPSEKSLNRSSPSLAYALPERKIYASKDIASSDAGSNGQVKEYSHKKSARAHLSSRANAQSASLDATDAMASNNAALDSLSRGTTVDARQDKKNTAGSFSAGIGGTAIAGAPAALSVTASQAANAKITQQNSQMVRSISSLMQSTKQLSELSQASESAGRTYASARAKRDYREDKTIATLPGGPVIQEYGSAPTANISGKNLAGPDQSVRIADGDMSDNSPLMVPDQPAQYRIMRNQLMALLPPSVVSGIPLVRLGATEQELAATLNKKNAQKQKIEDWTVWTLRGANEHSTGVQLYLRHSVVEAIRVFQPTYLGDEVGIKIGDDLLTVKRKFGEPALILPEPNVVGRRSPSQNYVYPISHVAFQLARAQNQPSPQVVSVLIFDVQ
jgi:hypothetical protein